MATEQKIPSGPSAAEIAAARKRGEERARTEPSALSARYDVDTGRVVIELTDGCQFAFPAELGQGLQGASAEQLADVEVLPGGSGLHWEQLDADLSVAGLVAGVFGSAKWMAEVGRKGGRSRSESKAAAARANGRKGGRPRKTPR